jgi:hypothetical protein
MGKNVAKKWEFRRENQPEFPETPGGGIYSTVTLLARFLGWSTLHPRATAM